MATSKLVVKHTFLEFDVTGEQETSQRRARCQTEPAGEWLRDVERSDDEMSRSTMAPSSKAVSRKDSSESSPLHADVSEPVFLVSATPEATPMFCPQLAQRPEQWAEPGMIERITGLDSFTLPEQYACSPEPSQGSQGWWAPMPFGYSGRMAGCTEFQRNPGITLGSLMIASGQQGRSLATPVLASQELMASATHRPAMTTSAATQADTGIETRTTVMIRNVPETYSRAALLHCLNAEGFYGKFDFMYLPIDFKRRVNLGYAFINLVSPNDALLFWKHFDGFSAWGMSGDAACTVNWSNPHQGLKAHIERYRDSPVMHESVPQDWRPMTFVHGVEVAFPPPTKHIKAPKVKASC